MLGQKSLLFLTEPHQELHQVQVEPSGSLPFPSSNWGLASMWEDSGGNTMKISGPNNFEMFGMLRIV